MVSEDPQGVGHRQLVSASGEGPRSNQPIVHSLLADHTHGSGPILRAESGRGLVEGLDFC